MRRTFWFLLGVGTTIATYVQGRRLYRGLLPASVQRQVESKAAEAAARLDHVARTYRAARAEREAELTARLRGIERGHLP